MAVDIGKICVVGIERKRTMCDNKENDLKNDKDNGGKGLREWEDPALDLARGRRNYEEWKRLSRDA